MESFRVARALVSVSDKTGLVDFARELARLDIEILSTGGTRRCLEEAGLPVRDVSAYTGFPEMMDGRVKTLHPKVHAGILHRRDHAEDQQALATHGIASLDLVVVNLYPFASTVAREGVRLEECIEQIDIGGPSLIRAAAKNHAWVTVVTSAAQYGDVLRELSENGRTSQELRFQLAARAFEHTAQYDQAISAWFARQLAVGSPPAPADAERDFPENLACTWQRRQLLRYGENPHQRAALYAEPGNPQASVVQARVLNGKELSYNNFLDLDSALAMVRVLPGPALAVIKHNNPCGAAQDEVLSVAARRALDGDPTSAFGSVLGVNRPLDAATAEVLVEPDRFIEAIVAPSFAPRALEILTTRPKWKANVRLLETGPLGSLAPGWEHRQLVGGMLRQEADLGQDPEAEWTVATRRQPTAQEWADLRFAWTMARFVKSNAIVVCRDQTLVGVGAGQMSRVDSTEIALRKAGPRAAGACLASDAFFPFADSIESASAARIGALIQPGGSRRDAEVVQACDQHGLAMVLTGRRHFKH